MLPLVTASSDAGVGLEESGHVVSVSAPMAIETDRHVTVLKTFARGAANPNAD